MKKNILYPLISTILLISSASAQLNFDRTRIVLDSAKSSSQSITVTNSSSTLPYLAQTWVENMQGEKITSPLAALPLLQRIDPNQKQQIRVNPIGDSSLFATDRESLYTLNVRGVPAKDPNEPANTAKVNVIIQSQLKIFYRPKGLPTYEKQNGWFEDLIVTKNGNQFSLNNPSPYHIVIYGFGKSKKDLITKDIIMKPFSSEQVSVNSGNTPFIFFIDDYGEAKAIHYNCASSPCTITEFIER
ncbi:molecular chaperone [Ignatzschineria rhizosphaerae]|uniref:Molecular chaperone n=1 Tax=Ignatzschineria rhizosphaerae TaxID=2923279 RepID=A0ABY3X5I3_9GAMM|nr:molecular chaperone [Ignatzschineria rhizosphaerae]UNM97009.1 molecular chaperone [Ignatzschineria rhizosphaerae]